jgi:hypothetical protein
MESLESGKCRSSSNAFALGKMASKSMSILRVSPVRHELSS